MIEIGISTASLFGKVEVENSFAVIRKLGCKVVEVFLTTFSEYRKEFTQTLPPLAKDLIIHSVHSLNNHYEPELFNISPRTTKDAEDIMRDVLYAGKLLGAGFYTFHGQARLKSKPYNVNFDNFGKRVDHICSICEEYGIKLCYENVHWALYNYSGFFSQLKKHAPNVMATLDIKQAIQAGVDVYDFAGDMRGSIATVHLCDVIGDKTCLPGMGEFDFYKLFVYMNENSVNAPALLEAYSGDYKSYDQLAASLDYLRELSYKASR